MSPGSPTTEHRACADHSGAASSPDQRAGGGLLGQVDTVSLPAPASRQAPLVMNSELKAAVASG